MTNEGTKKLGKTHAEITSKGSSLSRYQNLIVGQTSFSSLIYFELCRWMGAAPGALGLVLRKLFWPRLFASCGKGVIFGGGVILMHPNRIHIGARTVISENCVLDGRSPGTDKAVRLGEDVMLSHGVMISCKNGEITLGDRCGVGAYTVISSVAKSNPLSIGNDVVIGPRSYITGAGGYNMDRLDIPISQQGTADAGGSEIGNGVWIGAGVTVQGGVTIGHDAVIGSGAVVTKDMPALSVCGGVPAKILRIRGETENAV